jgi:diguanylate cyclase (GGDEF)-like protein
MAILCLKYRDKVNKAIVNTILIFIIIPFVAGCVQGCIMGLFVIWPAMTAAIIITYIFLETVSTSNDYLTSLNSRYRVDYFIDYLLLKGQDFGVLMIDLNNFKRINDEQGHREGDKTLVAFSKALQHVFSKEKMVARYGGDEFIVVTSLLKDNEVDTYIHKLLHATEDIVNFSIGYQGTDSVDRPTYENMVNGADFKMYEHKTIQKFNNGL